MKILLFIQMNITGYNPGLFRNILLLDGFVESNGRSITPFLCSDEHIGGMIKIESHINQGTWRCVGDISGEYACWRRLLLTSLCYLRKNIKDWHHRSRGSPNLWLVGLMFSSMAMAVVWFCELYSTLKERFSSKKQRISSR